MLSHSNIVSALGAFEYQDFYATSEDRHLSYLPMAHVLERMFFYGMMTVGGTVGVFNGDMNLLQKDLEQIQPTLFGSVPKLYSKFQEKINDKFHKQPFHRRLLINVGMKSKLLY